MKTELINGDCLEVMRTFPDAHFCAASFSPPYGVGGEGFDVRRDGGRLLP